MKTVDLHAQTTNLLDLVAEVEKTGKPVQICRNDKPMANLVPHVKRNRTSPHPVLSKIEINYDPTEPLEF